MQRVCAVIVTYNPSPETIDNIEAIRVQVAHVVLVDNGSSSQIEPFLLTLEARADCTVIRNQRNLGIAAALNIGFSSARAGGFEWTATFDQDSRVSDAFVTQMLETYSQFPNPERVAIITPTYIDIVSGVSGKPPHHRGKILATMTSGSMIPSSALNYLGMLDEELFMDYVDIDFCLRARRHGMTILQSPAVLFHSLGRTRYYRFCGVKFSATNHSAARRYYITRNRLRILWRYRTDWFYVLYDAKAMVAETVKIALVEDDRWRKFYHMSLGVRDAFFGKMGERVKL